MSDTIFHLTGKRLEQQTQIGRQLPTPAADQGKIEIPPPEEVQEEKKPTREETLWKQYQKPEQPSGFDKEEDFKVPDRYRRKKWD